jgi:hypothetical protein
MTENSTGRHTRQITASDGVSDEVAIAWSDREDARRTWGIAPSHRKAG